MRIPITKQDEQNEVKTTEATPVCNLIFNSTELIFCVARMARSKRMTRKMRTSRPILNKARSEYWQ